MKICEYGCGQEGKYFFSYVKKWCCSKKYSSCPEVKRKNIESNIGKKRSLETRKKQSKAKIGNKNPMFGKSHSEETRKKQHTANIGRTWEKVHGKKKTKILKDRKRIEMSGNKNPIKEKRLTIKKIKEKYSTFYKEEEMKYNPDKPKEKEIQVHCKYSQCKNSKENGGWFTPTRGHLCHRIYALERPNGNGGCYFYCSDECKSSCRLFRLRSDPNQSKNQLYTYEEYQIFRQEVLKRQLQEYGYNFCEYCDSRKTLHVHHEKPQKTNPLFVLDPDNGIVLCGGCHYIIGHKDECSTGNLANKIC